MIETLKDETIVNKVGGRFKLTALIQHRVLRQQGIRVHEDAEPTEA